MPSHMKVNFVSYIDPDIGVGGGEAIVRELLRATPPEFDLRRNHVLGRAMELHAMPDLTVVADVFNAPSHAGHPIRRALAHVPGTRLSRYWTAVERAVEARPIWLSNAYVDVCDRPYLPCAPLDLPTSRSCTRPDVPAGRHLLRPDGGETCFAWWTAELLGQAKQMWFLSPLHRDTTQAIVEPRQRLIAPQLLRPTLDPFPLLAVRGRTRDIPDLFVGSFTRAKGADEILASVDRLVVFGSVEHGLVDPKIDFRGRLQPVAIPDLLSRAKRVHFLPRWPEPFGRVAAEAVLAGCSLVTNELLGAASWRRPLDDPKFYERSAEEFWHKAAQAPRS